MANARSLATQPSGEMLGLMFDNVTDYAMFFVDPSGTITTWAPGVSTVLGYDAENFVGQPIACLFTEEDRRAGADARELETARLTGKAGDDRWHLRKDGTRVFVYGSLTALRSGTGELVGFVKILRDRTEHLQILQQLEAERTRATAASEDKEAFMAVLAHELHRPLNAIRGWAYMAVEGTKSPEQIAVALHRILRSSETMLRLVNDLLDISRIVAGKFQLGTARASLGDIIDHAVAEVEASAQDKGLSLVVELRARPYVTGDPSRLGQVLTNLLSNAIKYTAQGRVTVTLDQQNGEVRILVADTGQGIPAEQLPHLFQRFRRLPDEEHRSAGLGLGLWVSNEIVRAHGGRLTVDSQGTGRGSTFIVTLPRHRDGGP